MNVLITITAAIIVFAGVYFSQIENKDTNQTDLSNSTQSTTSSAEKKNISPTSSPSAELSPTIILQPSEEEIPTPSQSHLSLYHYPNSIEKEREENRLELESKDDVDMITDWYEYIIKKQGMNIQSFVKTSANDNVINKLSAADGNREIYVEIKKPSNTSTVRIAITLNNE